jgi:uncharacterized protein YuzE
MRWSYDSTSDLAYLYFAESEASGRVVRSETVQPHDGEPADTVVLDFDAQGMLVGIEFIGARAFLSPNLLAEALATQ